MTNERKSVAPQEHGQLPNEKRCRNCWRLLSLYEVSPGKAMLWCSHCKTFYNEDKVKE